MKATAAPPPPTPEFYSVAEVLTILGMKDSEFRANYAKRFTDTRPIEKRTRRVPLRFRRSEVEIVVRDGWERLAAVRAAERIKAEQVAAKQGK